MTVRLFQVGVKGLIAGPKGVLLLRDGSFWDLPGGRIDDAEGTLEALSRELKEELPGVYDIRIGDLIGCDRVTDLNAELSLFIVVYRVTAQLPDPVELSLEHDHAEWVSVAQAQKILAHMPIDWQRITA